MTRIAVGASVLLGEPVSQAAVDAHIAGLVDGYGIPPAYASQLPLTGSPAQVAERLAMYVDAGAAHIVVDLIGDDWREQCALLAQAKSLLGGP